MFSIGKLFIDRTPPICKPLRKQKKNFTPLRGGGGNATIMGVGQVGGKRAKFWYGGFGFGFGIRLGMLGKLNRLQL